MFDKNRKHKWQFACPFDDDANSSDDDDDISFYNFFIILNANLYIFILDKI